MPKDELNAKQAMVLDLHIGGKPLSAAYQEVYQCSEQVAHASASRLLKNVKFSDELARRRADIEREVKIDTKELIKRFDRLAKKAEDKGEFGNANKSNEQIGRLIGAYVDKSEDKSELVVRVVREETK